MSYSFPSCWNLSRSPPFFHESFPLFFRQLARFILLAPLGTGILYPDLFFIHVFHIRQISHQQLGFMDLIFIRKNFIQHRVGISPSWKRYSAPGLTSFHSNIPAGTPSAATGYDSHTSHLKTAYTGAYTTSVDVFRGSDTHLCLLLFGPLSIRFPAFHQPIFPLIPRYYESGGPFSRYGPLSFPMPQFDPPFTDYLSAACRHLLIYGSLLPATFRACLPHRPA